MLKHHLPSSNNESTNRAISFNSTKIHLLLNLLIPSEYIITYHNTKKVRNKGRPPSIEPEKSPFKLAGFLAIAETASMCPSMAPTKGRANILCNRIGHSLGQLII